MAKNTTKKATTKSKKTPKVAKVSEKKTDATPEKSGKLQSAKSKVTKKRLIYAGCAVVVILFAVLIWQYNKARAELRKQKNPDVAIQEEGKDTQAEVSKVMVLPKGETPTIANISDVSKLKDRAFFANAENGDKVLIYKEAKKAIIYRPSTKQIVEVATYNVSSEDPTAVPKQ